MLANRHTDELQTNTFCWCPPSFRCLALTAWMFVYTQRVGQAELSRVTGYIVHTQTVRPLTWRKQNPNRKLQVYRVKAEEATWSQLHSWSKRGWLLHELSTECFVSGYIMTAYLYPQLWMHGPVLTARSQVLFVRLVFVLANLAVNSVLTSAFRASQLMPYRWCLPLCRVLDYWMLEQWSTRIDYYMALGLHNITAGWLGSRVVSVLESVAEWSGFKSHPRCCRVTVLGKLFTPVVPLFTKQQNW